MATHSDALLDALAVPARSAVLCDLDERATTRWLRLITEKLQGWLENYRGLGELRSPEYEEAIFPSLETK